MSTTSILIIAHAPLAHALRECALHVFPDCGDNVAALDVQPNQPPEESLAQARILLDRLGPDSTLVLTDVFGATPCNVAQRLVDAPHQPDPAPARRVVRPRLRRHRQAGVAERAYKRHGNGGFCHNGEPDMTAEATLT